MRPYPYLADAAIVLTPFNVFIWSDEMTSSHAHAQWSSRMGFVLAATGSAVGLGNIWKFPYMVGQSGGAAFVLVYLVCIALIGLPILVSEWLIGRRGQKNPINTMAQLAEQNGHHRSWALIGGIGILGAFLILSFYSVIGGWALAYMLDAATGAFSGLDKNAIGASFEAFLASPGTLFGWHTAFMSLTAIVVAMGVSGGLERGSKVMMPALGLILLVLVGYGTTTGSFGAAVEYLFKPDWSKLDGQVLLAALGHAFFTLSLGMGIMMAYGSYLGQEVNLLRTARTVVLMDTAIALCAGLAIFPIVIAHGLDPSAGPGLIFVTLPIAFGNMTGGIVLGALFFLLLTFAALTSSISLLEPVVELLEERTSLGRAGATLVASITIWALGIAALLSFNLWSGVKFAGLNIFDLLDYVTSKFMLPVAGLGAIVFAAWKLEQGSVRQELGLSQHEFKLWTFLSRYVTPLGVLFVFWHNI